MGRRRASVGRLLLGLGILTTLATFLAAQGTAASGRAQVIPQSLVGCWHRHVGALPVGTGPGVWAIKITRAGKLAAYTPGTTACNAYSDFTATVSVVRNVLTIGRVPICGTTGIYTWKASAKTLTLQAKTDQNCPSRAMLLTGVWRR